MYYAACCCGSSPVCGCGDYTYASVSFATAVRYINPIVFQNLCDRPCRRGHALAESDVTTKYVEAKVYMRCGTSGGLPGTYRTEDIPNQFQKFDPDSVKILETRQMSLIETSFRPELLDCCGEFASNICFETGQFTRIKTASGSLLPFDVLDPDGGPCAGVLPEGSTYVARGDQFADAPVVVSSQPNKYFRKTTVGISWSLLFRTFYYEQGTDGNVETSETTELSGGGFGCTQNILSVRRWSLVGDECDSHAIGTEVATQGSRSPGVWYDLPFTDYINVAEEVNCNATTYFANCCDPLNQPWPATSGSIDFTIGTEQDGGVFNLEFMDEPPPPAP